MNNKRTPFQRILSLLCAGVMLFSITPVQSFAEDVKSNSQEGTVSQAEAEPQPAAEPQSPAVLESAGVAQPAGEPQPVADIPVDSVQLSQNTLELAIGGEATLTATVEPADATDPAVSWTSSLPDVVSVTDGTVRALKAGSATITATAGGQSATCVVTVKKNATTVTVTIASVEYGTESVACVKASVAGKITITGFPEQTVEAGKETTVQLGKLDAGKRTFDYKFVPSDGENYEEANGQATTSVDRKKISVQSFTLANSAKEYDGSAAFVVGSVILGTEIEPGDDVSANAAGFTANASQVNAGPVSVSLSVTDENNVLTGADAGNYTLASLENLAPVSGTISQKPLSVTEVAFGGKEYDGSAEIPESLATVTFDGLVGSDEVKLAGASYRIKDSVTVGDSKAVEADFDNASLTGAAANNYTLTPVANPTLGTVSVTAKELTVQVTNGFVAQKTSDGTNVLTDANKGAIQKALSLNGKVPSDDVALEVDFSNAVYASASVFGNNSIQNLALSLSGTDTANYKLKQEETNYSVQAKITANAAKDVDLSQLADGIAQIADSVTIAFQPGTNAESKAPYWYTAAPALVNPDTVQLLDKNGNDYTFPTLEQGKNICDNVYALINNVYYGPFCIVYQGDSVAPVIDVDHVESVQFGKPWNKELQYTFVITDDNSGVDTTSLQYYVGKKDLDADQIQDWQPVTPEKIAENEYRFTVSAPENSSSNRLYIRVQDMAGNTEALYSYCTLVVENTPPELTVDLGGVDTGIPHKGYTITANALDESSNDEILYSGVRQIQYVLTTQGENGTEIVLSKAITADDTPSALANLWKYQNLEGKLDLGDQSKYNGTYTLTVTATDFCGNETTQTITLEYDNTPAKIKVDMADPYQENYFRADNCGVTVTFTDDNLWVTDGSGEIGDYTVTLTGTEKGGKKDAVLTKSLTAKQEGDDDTTGTIVFTADEITAAFADGNVKISATATDTAGNASTAVDSSFELDTTAPELTKVSATEDGNYYAEDGKVYYNKDFTLTYIVDDSNYDADEVSFANNAQTETGDAVVTTNAGKEGVITWTVSGQADNAVYKPSLTVKDKAGNALVAGSGLETTGKNAAEVANGTASLKTAFVLDTVTPKLTSVQMTEGGREYDEGIYYQGSFAVAFTVEETNYDASDDKCAVTSVVEGDAKPLEVAKATTSDGHTVTVTASRVDTEKTTYAISLAVADKAGNLMESEVNNTTIVEGKATAKTCIMDNVNPVAKLSYTDLDATHFYAEQDGKELTAYYNGDITTTLQLTDKGSIDTNLVSFTRYKDGEALAVELPAYDPKQVVEKVEVDNTVEAGEDHAADGVYTYTLSGTDKAGNPLNVLEEDVFGKTPENPGDGDATIRFAEGCGADNVYTTAVKAMDTVNPTVEITYTDLDATHFYQEEGSSLVNAYYNHDFTAAFSFTEQYGTEGETFGMDGAKLHYVQGLTKASDKDLTQAHANGEATVQVQYDVTGQAEDAHYTFTAYGEDKAGNPLIVTEHDTTAPGATVTYEDGKAAAYESNYQKVLDTVAPTFSLALGDPKNTSVSVDGDRAYYNTDIQATFTVKDVNLDDGKINTLTNSKLGFDFNYDEADVSWQSGSLQHNAAEPVRNIIERTLTAADDGVYRFQIEGEDRAGNRLVQAKDEAAKTGFRATLSQGEGKFWTNVKVHDTVAPKLSVAFSDSETFYQSLLANDGEGSYYMVSLNKPYRSTSSVSGLLTKDDCSPAKVTYQVESTTKDQALTKDGYDHSALNMKMEGAQIFYLSQLEISDRAGNSSVMPGATSKIYMDVEVPETDNLVPNVSVVALTTDAVRGQAGTDLYKSDVTVRATVTDPGEGINASGLYQVYYKVLVNGEDWTDKVAVSSKGAMAQPGLLVYGTSGEGVSITPPADETISCQDVIDFTFKAETFNYNDVKVFVWAQDNAGNLLEESLGARYQFGIDITAPTIRVSYDNNDVQNEKYFKNDRTATVVVTERNFDPNNTTISTQNEASISGWSYEAGSMANGDDDTWTCQVTYSQDGDYTFDVSTTDLVGHKNGDVDYAGSAAPREFTVDKTAPVIQIEFDNNDVRNGKYYNAVRTATVQILEHNFSTEGVTLTTTANIQEGSVTAPAAGGWSSGNDMNIAHVPFTADGNYTMDVAFVDLAGNEAEPKSVEEFVVDTTAPELEISGVEDRMAYNGDVAPVITYHDINYDPQSAGVTIQGYKNSDGTNLSGVHTEDAFGGSFVCDNIEPVKENDDVYTARGVVTDMAGNETEVSVMFSVNRFGSTYFFADDTQTLLDNYYTNQPQALHVTEINVDGLATRRVTTSLNGDLKDLQEGTDYTVTESVPGWHQFDYTVNAANFETEGIYDVTFYSEDEAGNASSNRAVKENDAQTSDLPVSFVVDMTAPVNVITGVDNNEQYIATERTIMVNYDDNIGLRDLTIYVNDQVAAEYTADDLKAAGGAVEYLAKAANQWQQLTVVSTDMAGNVSEQSMVRYLLTDNLFVQYFNNKPLFYGSLVAVAALVALTVVFVKKKGKQTTNA